MEDLTGRVFGRLTALYKTDEKKVKWHCRCECGQETDVPAYDLTSGHTRSCGCLTSRNKDLTGQRFGRLTVLCPTSERQQNRVVWHCRCDCGNEVDYASTTLKSGRAVSCGCAKQAEDLTGQRFGRWTVLKKAERRNYWVCRCDCGTVKENNSKTLKRGDSKSCGCLPRKDRDYTGEKRGRLTAIQATGRIIGKSPEYIWRCDCGNELKLPVSAVPLGSSRMCQDCSARQKQEGARKMLKKRTETEIQGIAPAALKNIKDGELPVNNTSGVRGVWKDKKSDKWIAAGNAKGRRVTLGMYDDLRDAAEIREKFIQDQYREAFEILELRGSMLGEKR